MANKQTANVFSAVKNFIKPKVANAQTGKYKEPPTQRGDVKVFTNRDDFFKYLNTPGNTGPTENNVWGGTAQGNSSSSGSYGFSTKEKVSLEEPGRSPYLVNPSSFPKDSYLNDPNNYPYKNSPNFRGDPRFQPDASGNYRPQPITPVVGKSPGKQVAKQPTNKLAMAMRKIARNKA